MQFYKSLIVAALAAVAVAQRVQFTSTPTAVEAGKPVTITWQGGNPSQPYTVILRQGNSAALNTVGELTTTSGNSYTWTPPNDLPTGGDYALEIKQGTESNYSGQFPLTGGSSVARPTASASAAASSASAAASSAAAASTSARASSASAATASSVSAASATSASRASVSSVISSVVASASSAASAASASRSAAASSAASGSRTASSTVSASSSSVTADSGSARLSSPLALVFGAVVAMAYLN